MNRDLLPSDGLSEIPASSKRSRAMERFEFTDSLKVIGWTTGNCPVASRDLDDDGDFDAMVVNIDDPDSVWNDTITEPSPVPASDLRRHPCGRRPSLRMQPTACWRTSREAGH